MQTSTCKNKRATARPTSPNPSTTDEFIKIYLESLDSPTAAQVLDLYRSKRHLDLTGISIDPHAYTDPLVFRRDLSAVSFLSKSKFLQTGIDKRARAIEKFRSSEELCARTNKRLRDDPAGSDAALMHLVFSMRRIIRATLGPFRTEEMLDRARWGPGATTLIKRRIADYPTKFLLERGITGELLTVMHEVKLWEAYPSWGLNPDSLIKQAGNKVVTVPKNAKTDRIIAIEPGLNLWFQLGIGDMIRSRLKGVGIDLDSQSRNQRLAKRGSETGHLATIDFSSASDTISRELVRVLFDAPDLRLWLYAMEACRSHVGLLDNRPLHWEKFSSMGNGFTFELETLIFYAAAIAVCNSLNTAVSEVSVYGDDVIIPTDVVVLFEKLCSFLGFQFNREKSFWSGGFRESCGEYYFSGVDCKPIFLKERIMHAAQVYKTANLVRDQAHRWGFRSGCAFRFRTCWNYLFQALEPDYRFCSSFGFVSDSAFIVNHDEALAHEVVRLQPRYLRDGHYGWEAMVHTRKIVWSKAEHDHHGALLYGLRYTATDAATLAATRLLGLDASEDVLSDRETRLARPVGFRFVRSWLRVPTWYDLGPWLETEGL